ncbi:long-chain fatty acid--CoA ligase [Promicromonospora sp. Populi]|uniref:acyl-CoA synthetase n=1 Tax=Promicromonospora sp. Populi TaxID=3239420 RepID=UPI0034E2DC54
MRDLGIGSLPARRAKNAGARTAVVHGAERYTYAELERRTRCLANALRAAGVRRGDRVAYAGFNHPALLETFFATARLGAVWVVVNPRLSQAEIEVVLTDSGASMVVHGAELAAHAAALAPRLDGVRWVRVGSDYSTFLAGGSDDVVDEPVTWDDDALIMYTSGTTGRPKGVTHTHGSLLFQYFGALLDTDLVRDEVYLAVAPLFHVAGLNTLALPTFLKGGTLVIRPAFRPADTLAAITEHQVTALFAVPTMMEQMAADPSFAAADLASLRSVLVGGSPLSHRMLRAWGAKGVQVQQGFGTTETAPGVFLLLPEDSERRPGSAGLEQFWAEARIVLPDGGSAAPGETGEVLVQGPNVMRGYWNQPDATAEAIRDGWYHTGDLGSYDEDGYAWIKDRLKDMFISGGENVYPAEVENALLDVPGVAEAAVVGVPDERWGEVGHAFLVRAAGAGLTEAAVLAALDGRLARYKLPKHVTFTDTLPRTATGKLRKHLITPAIDPDEIRPDEETTR